MEYTKNLRLSKPSYDDDVDVQVLNINMDIIDDRLADEPYLPIKGGNVTGNVNFVNGASAKFVNGINDGAVRMQSDGTMDVGVATSDVVNKLNLSSRNRPTWSLGSDITKQIAMLDDIIVAQKLDRIGFVKFASGLIIQWGESDFNTSTYLDVTLPIACKVFIATCSDSIVNIRTRGDEFFVNWNSGYSNNNTSIRFLTTNTATGNFVWICIGKEV